MNSVRIDNFMFGATGSSSRTRSRHEDNPAGSAGSNAKPSSTYEYCDGSGRGGGGGTGGVVSRASRSWGQKRF